MFGVGLRLSRVWLQPGDRHAACQQPKPHGSCPSGAVRNQRASRCFRRKSPCAAARVRAVEMWALRMPALVMAPSWVWRRAAGDVRDGTRRELWVLSAATAGAGGHRYDGRVRGPGLVPRTGGDVPETVLRPPPRNGRGWSQTDGLLARRANAGYLLRPECSARTLMSRISRPSSSPEALLSVSPSLFAYHSGHP